MRKLASHYIICGKLFRFYCLAMEAEQFSYLYPLEQEEAGVAFYNGLLWVLPAQLTPEQLPWHQWRQLPSSVTLKEIINDLKQTVDICPGDQVCIWHFPDLTLAASEFSTDDSCGNTHIQRL